MNGWFYTGFPKGMFDQVGAMVKTSPIDTTMTSWFFGGGAVAMIALLYFRQMIFWLPHPIGMIMLVNPIMNAYWFSILIGWLAKVLVTRYGNKDTYRIVRGLFVGLIVGGPLGLLLVDQLAHALLPHLAQIFHSVHVDPRRGVEELAVREIV